MRKLEAIYRDEKRYKDWNYGFRSAMKAAASFINEHKASANGYRLGDLLLCKFNQTNRKPRRVIATAKK